MRLQLQVVTGLDDALMCLAELQLQQEGTDSCAGTLNKAGKCIRRLQDNLTDPSSSSSGQTKLLVEVGGASVLQQLLLAESTSVAAVSPHACHTTWATQSCMHMHACMQYTARLSLHRLLNPVYQTWCCTCRLSLYGGLPAQRCTMTTLA